MHEGGSSSPFVPERAAIFGSGCLASCLSAAPNTPAACCGKDYCADSNRLRVARAENLRSKKGHGGVLARHGQDRTRRESPLATGGWINPERRFASVAGSDEARSGKAADGS